MQLSKSADDYICELLAEKYAPWDEDNEILTKPMLHGLECEPESRAWYALMTDEDVKQIGFCTTDCGRFGASPDSAVGDEGGLELKCPMPKTHLSYLLGNKLPDDYKAQVHGQLVVTGWKWVDFVSYARGLPPFKIRVEPDEYTEALRSALEQFWLRYQQLEKMIVDMVEGSHLEIEAKLTPG